MKYVTAVIVALGLLMLGTIPASAEEATTVATQIVDSPDNDCPAWARDTFTRTTTVTEDGDGYTIDVDESGTFAAESGITGTLSGYLKFTATGVLNDDDLAALDGETLDFSGYDCKSDVPAAEGAGQWPGRFLDDGKWTMTDWSYTYDTGCESFTETTGTDAVGADTFAGICATPAEPTVTQPTCDEPAKLTVPEVEGVAYEDSGDPTPGHTVTVVAAPTEGYVFAEGVQDEWTFDIAAVPGCDGDDGDDGDDGQDGSDGTSGKDGKDADAAVPTAIPAGSKGELPKTGGPGLLALGGAVLTAAGGGLLALRRKFGL